jgi:uncharacterized protein (TIGR03437 family)
VLLTLGPNSLPTGAVGKPYSAQLTSDGNSTSIWSITAGSLPPGLTLTSQGSVASITGTPSAAGTYSFTAHAFDPDVQKAGSKNYSIGILQITTPSPLPSGMVLVDYSQTFIASDGSLPYTFNLALKPGETFPTGLSLSPDGTLSGVPALNSAGAYSFTVGVRDGTGVQTTATFALTITPALTITTPSTLPAGGVGTLYSQTISASGGTSPYTFSISTGAAPPGLTLSASGVLSGTPTTLGSSTFTVKAVDSLQFSVTKQFQVSIGSAAPLLQVSPLQLSFSAASGGDAPVPQAITIVGAGRTPVNFAVQIDGGPTNPNVPGWITVRPVNGVTPGVLIVTVDQTGLPAATFPARIRVIVPQNSAQAPIDVSVSFAISTATPKLRVTPDSLRYAGRIQAPATIEQVIAVSNSGGGGALGFTASIVQHSSWISGLTPTAGQTGPNAPVWLHVNVNTQGVGVGSYHDIVRISSPAGTVDVPVSLFVSDQGAILGVGVVGLRFPVRQGAGTTELKTVKVLDLGATGTTLNWSADLLSGSDWLSLVASRGTATVTNPGSLVISPNANTSSFPVGGRYALVRVSDPQALNSPQYVVAVLDVEPSSTSPQPDPAPAGLYFTTAGGTPAAQTVTVFTSSTGPVAFQAAAATTDGANWLTVNVTTPAASTQSSGAISVSVSATGLAAGIYTGRVNIAMNGVARVVSVNVTFVVTPSLGGSVRSGGLEPQAAGACTPSRLAVTQTGLVNNFTVPAGWPATLIVQLNDDCGNAVTNGAAVASFSNGDPALSLSGDHQTGTYSATWQPGVVTPQMTVTVRATAPLLPAATAQWIGGIDQNTASPPALVPNGILHIFFNAQTAATVGGGFAPGNVAQVYGTGLSSTTGSTGVVPLPTQFNGTFMLVGNTQAPLYYVANIPAAQFGLNIQIPFELTPNRQYATIVSANGALTLPQMIDVVPLQPGMAVLTDGSVIAQHLDYSLVTASNPAKPGETLIIYLAGMGPTNPAVKSGDPTPLDYVLVTNQPTVTVDGQSASVGFAGLTPTGVGLYQIAFTVPSNARSGSLDLVVSQGGVFSNTTKLPVAAP